MKFKKLKGHQNRMENEEETSLFQNVTTLHGMNHFSTKKGMQLFLWSSLMVLNIALTIAFLIFIEDKYKHNDSIVTKIYSGCTLDQVPFPAVSICNLNVVSLSQTEGIVNILTRNNISQSEIHSFFHDLPKLKISNMQSSTYRRDNHTEIMDILKRHHFSVKTIMQEVHQKCENLLIYCEFNGKQKECSTIFQLAPTYKGVCCSFNYFAVDGDGEEPFLDRADEDFEYHYDRTEAEPQRTSQISTSQFGKSSGLRVVIDVEPQDYAKWTFTLNYGANVLINDPNDYPETTAVTEFITMGESADLKVIPSIYTCDANMRDVDPKIRKCWFHDEVSLEYTDRYSFETCTTECKMKSFREICGCVPYKYPTGKWDKNCEFQDLTCLRDTVVHWETRKKPCVPECYQECSDREYRVETNKVPMLKDRFPETIRKNRNLSELINLEVYFDQPTFNCYKMSLLMDFNYFVATYGGVLSLTFGASIVSLFEVTFLLLSTMLKVLRRCHNDTTPTIQFVN